MIPFAFTPTVPAMAGCAVMALAACVEPSTAQNRFATKHVAKPVQCAVVIRDLGDTVEISGKVRSDQNIDGRYAFAIRQQSGSGSALIDQSGEFSVQAGRMVTLGQAVLSGPAQSYDADLKVISGGHTYTCSAQDDAADI